MKKIFWNIYVKLQDKYRVWRSGLLRKLGKAPPHFTLRIDDICQGSETK